MSRQLHWQCQTSSKGHHAWHYLQLNGAEGTSLERMHFSRFRGIRHGLNTTRLYGPMLGAIRKWFWDSEHHHMVHADQEKTWLKWLAQYKTGGTAVQEKEGTGEMKNAFGVSRAAHLRSGPPREPPTSAKLLSRAEYLSAEDDTDTPLWGNPAFDKSRFWWGDQRPNK